MVFRLSLYLSILLLLLSPRVSGQVTADFTPDVTGGCSPLVVSFANTSTNASTYSWDLGNGATSTLTNPSASYVYPGTYNVKLTASKGAQTSVKTVTITVFAKPSVGFSANSNSVCDGVAVQFTNTSSSPGATPLTYNWNFGDGTFSTAVAPTHTFTGPGIYNITLNVKNSKGCDSTLTQSAMIHVLSNPSVNFTASANMFCKAPAHAVFSDATTGGTGPYTYAWQFGDTKTAATANPTHDYATAGTAYNVDLTVTDAAGCKNTISKPAYITIGNLAPSFTITKACVGQVVPVINTTPNASGLSFTWNFGDANTNATELTATPSHAYFSTGTYKIKMIVTNGVCTDSVVKTITVYNAPNVTMFTSPERPCPAPTDVHFSATGPVGATYQWLFMDDNSISTQASPVHHYFNNGFYNYSLVVTDTNGCMTTVTDEERIYDLVASIQTDVVEGCVPLKIQFRDSLMTTQPNSTIAGYPDTAVSYTWDFGDGITSTLANPLHIFNKQGHFRPILTIKTANGGCTVSTFVDIQAGIKPVVNSVDITRTGTCISSVLKIKAYTTTLLDTPLVYRWLMGDSTRSIDYFNNNEMRYSYIAPGTYHPRLVIINRGCPSDTFLFPNPIIVDSPFARALLSRGGPTYYSCANPLYDTMVNASIGATSVLWKFDDGTTDTSTNVVRHTFPTYGFHNWELIAYSSRSGCTDTFKASANQIKLGISAKSSDSIICRGGIINFTSQLFATPSNAFPIGYVWYVDGVYKVPYVRPGGGFGGPNPAFKDTFNTPGYHTISVAIMDEHACLSNDSLSIFVGNPQDTFSISAPNGCRPVNIIFTDRSKTPANTFITNRYWDFGDNTTATATTPTISHLYNTAGTFTVTQIITNNIGCTDTFSQAGFITVFKPTAAFAASKTSFCAGDSTLFMNSSFGRGTLKYKWQFGDGGTDTAANPTHAYKANGTYTVRLVILDSLGCTDTLIQPNYINVAKPAASFLMSDSTAICPPLNVVFTNTTNGGNTYNWDFGNNNASIATNPVNIYGLPGTYTVTLIATNTQGCKDTVTHQVKIYGYAGAFSYTPLLGCNPVTVNFTANVTNVNNIRFDFSDGNISAPSPSTTASHKYNAPGKYVPRILLSNGGCLASSTGLDTIKVDFLQPVYTLSQKSVCIHDTVQFNDSSFALYSAVNSWLWTFGNGQSSALKHATHVFDAPGYNQVSISVSSSSGCKATFTDSIFVHSLPAIKALGDTTICLTDSAILSGRGGISYNWYPTTTIGCATCKTTKASPAKPTVYTVIGKDANGCMATDSVKVQIKTKTIGLPGKGGVICDGDSLQLSDSGGQVYTWYPADGLSSNKIANPVAFPHSSTTYLVVSKLASCLPDSDYIVIKVNPKPNVKASGGGTAIAGNTVQLQVTGNNVVAFLWSPGGSLSCTECSDPISSADTTTVYTVKGFSQYGCIDSDKITVRILCDHSQVFIPNTFTPNNDGQNDVFYPRGTGISLVNSFRVYDRWGQLVFQRDNIHLNDERAGWNGTYGNSQPKPDVYVYIVDATCSSGEPISWTGDVTLIR